MNKTVLVGHLIATATVEQVADLFSRTRGSIVSITMPTNEKNGNNRGYALVEMGSESEAQEAAVSLNGRDVNGQSVQTSLSDLVSKPARRKWYQWGASP